MLLTDRNFNTNFYDPALRHSSVQTLNYTLSGAFYHSALTETAPGLFAGADSNELLFLGATNSTTMGIVLRKTAFPKSIFITRSAKAKVHFKTGSTYETLSAHNSELKRNDRVNLHDIIERVYYSRGGPGRILVITPEQNKSCNGSPTLDLTLVGDGLNMHSGNLGKYFSSNRRCTFSIMGQHQYKEKLSGERKFNKSSVTIPGSLKLKIQEGASLNGGKIVEKAKVFGNAKNTLNSMRLNNANQ